MATASYSGYDHRTTLFNRIRTLFSIGSNRASGVSRDCNGKGPPVMGPSRK